VRTAKPASNARVSASSRSTLVPPEEVGAAAADDGIDSEPELVDEVVLQKRAREFAAAVDDDRLTGLLLQFGDLLRESLLSRV
jgi:hypothetical protein